MPSAALRALRARSVESGALRESSFAAALRRSAPSAPSAPGALRESCGCPHAARLPALFVARAVIPSSRRSPPGCLVARPFGRLHLRFATMGLSSIYLSPLGPPPSSCTGVWKMACARERKRAWSTIWNKYLNQGPWWRKRHPAPCGTPEPDPPTVAKKAPQGCGTGDRTGACNKGAERRYGIKVSRGMGQKKACRTLQASGPAGLGSQRAPAALRLRSGCAPACAPGRFLGASIATCLAMAVAMTCRPLPPLGPLDPTARARPPDPAGERTGPTG